ncbi:hypothetical protein [Geodermatophilus sp. SYSU D01176]
MLVDRPGDGELLVPAGRPGGDGQRGGQWRERGHDLRDAGQLAVWGELEQRVDPLAGVALLQTQQPRCLGDLLGVAAEEPRDVGFGQRGAELGRPGRIGRGDVVGCLTLGRLPAGANGRGRLVAVRVPG